MCFSPQADVIGGIVVGVIGVDVIRHVPAWRDHRALAALPLLFAAHQLDEALVWWALQGHLSWSVGRVATWAYLLFAFVVLPTFVPIAILLVEPPGRRRWIISPFVALGVIVSTVLLVDMVHGPVTATLGQYHVAYSIASGTGLLIVGLYVVATCGALLFSGYRAIAIFGIVNLIAVAALAHLTVDGFASLWCGWAAVSSAALALHLRFSRPNQQLQPAI